MTRHDAGYSLSIVAAIAVGQLNDPVILSAVVLAGSIYNVTGLSLVIGLSAGMDTIAGENRGVRPRALWDGVGPSAHAGARPTACTAVACTAAGLHSGLHARPVLGSRAAEHPVLPAPRRPRALTAGQAYGAGNLLMVGETLQRATLICWAICVPIVMLWHYAAEFMAALHQSPEIIAPASRCG